MPCFIVKTSEPDVGGGENFVEYWIANAENVEAALEIVAVQSDAGSGSSTSLHKYLSDDDCTSKNVEPGNAFKLMESDPIIGNP